MHEALQLRLNLVRTMECFHHTSLSMKMTAAFNFCCGQNLHGKVKPSPFCLYPLPLLRNLLFPLSLSFLSGLNSRRSRFEHQFSFLHRLLAAALHFSSIGAKGGSKKPLFDMNVSSTVSYFKAIKSISPKLSESIKSV